MLFEESLIVTFPERKKGRIKWYFVGTVIGYSFIVASLIVGSILLAHPQLNEILVDSVLVSPPPPPPPPPPPAGGSQMVPRSARVQIAPTAFVPPTVTPRRLPAASDLPTVDAAPSGGVPGGVTGGVPGGVVGGVLGGMIGGVLGATPTVAAAPPPSPPNREPSPSLTKPRPVSAGILLGNSIRQVPPVYPLLARSAQIEGTVEVRIIVDEQGNVVAAEVLSGHPLLQQPAVDAARQWKFRPTLLNGRPIKVSGILTFTFKLS